jgi:hypothetical protein
MELQLLTSLTSLPIINLTDSLPVNKNYTWAELCGVRDPNKLTTIVIHHDALEKGKYANLSDTELASRIATGHIDKTGDHAKGEPGNPYHVWVRNGQAYQINNLLDFTYGVPSNNGYTVHVCVSGEYRYADTITDADYNMLCTAIVSLLQFEQLPNLKIIKGHREMSPTVCPGIDLSKLRADVQNIQHWLEGNNLWDRKKEKIEFMGKQFKFLNENLKKGENDGLSQWAMYVYMDVYDYMKEKKYL